MESYLHTCTSVHTVVRATKQLSYNSLSFILIILCSPLLPTLRILCRDELTTSSSTTDTRYCEADELFLAANDVVQSSSPHQLV